LPNEPLADRCSPTCNRSTETRAASIGHDLKNILTAINMAAEMALDALADDHAARPDVFEIQRSTSRASALTDRLLAFAHSKVPSPMDRLSEAVRSTAGTDVGAVIRAIEPVLRRLVEGNAVLTVEAPTGLGHVPLDPVAIESIVVNLVVNARDAQPFEGRIVVNVEKCVIPGTFRPGVQISVADGGTGIPPEIRDTIFEPFVTTKLHGSGLGLAIVADVARSIGGNVDAFDQAQGGTVFRVVLPRLEKPSDGGHPAPLRLVVPCRIEGGP
jgi:two-component system cell cycle sensor histidine kinase/response regulator CckA